MDSQINQYNTNPHRAVSQMIIYKSYLKTLLIKRTVNSTKKHLLDVSKQETPTLQHIYDIATTRNPHILLDIKLIFTDLEGTNRPPIQLWKKKVIRVHVALERWEKMTRVILSFKDNFFSVCPNLNPSFRLDFSRLLRNLIVTGYKSKVHPHHPLINHLLSPFKMEGKWVGRTPEGVGLVVKLAGGD
ncbi:hypothetical protein YC2023_114699 [Brassica napus]